MLKEGKYTLEKFVEKNKLKKQSALNLLSKLKKEGLVEVSGGGKQKRIYTIYKFQKRKTTGFFDIANKYSPEKLQPKFEHYVYGKYTIEKAIIDGIKIGDARTLQATMYLFRHIKNWKSLFAEAKKEKCTNQLITLYKKARQITRCKRMPKRYLK